MLINFNRNCFHSLTIKNISKHFFHDSCRKDLSLRKVKEIFLLSFKRRQKIIIKLLALANLLERSLSSESRAICNLDILNYVLDFNVIHIRKRILTQDLLLEKECRSNMCRCGACEKTKAARTDKKVAGSAHARYYLKEII